MYISSFRESITAQKQTSALSIVETKCMKNSCASCCLLVENSGWPRPITDLNIWGAIPSCSLETNQVLQVKYCNYIQACVVSVSDRVITRTLTERTQNWKKGEGEGFPFSPSSSSICLALATTFSTNSRRNTRRLTASLQLVQATDVTYNKARDVAHVIPFILNICRGSIVYTYLTITRPKFWVFGRNTTLWLFKSNYFDSSSALHYLFVTILLRSVAGSCPKLYCCCFCEYTQTFEWKLISSI